jgi:Ca-activated chloride channel family protein
MMNNYLGGGKNMARKGNVSRKRRFFSMSTTGAVTHTVGNVKINSLTDWGRTLGYIYTSSTRHTVTDPSAGNALGFIGLVLDHDGYNHPVGSEEVADSYLNPPYVGVEDLQNDGANPMTMFDDGTLQKSIGHFYNNGAGDPNDVYVDQTCWTVVNEDWAIVQWAVRNQKGVAINNFCLGLEVPLSVTGGGYGVGGDSGDDIDGFDPVESTYWAQDDSGTTIGFSSAIASEPINHYYAVDYNTTYTFTEWKNLYANDAWLYNRIHAPNTAVGATPGNRTTTVGWNGVTINPGSVKTFTLVIAINDSMANMESAVQDARTYYNTIASRFYITEFSDADSASQQIEVYSHGKAPTNMAGAGYFLSVDGGLTALTGTWEKNPLPTYEYTNFTLTAGSIGPEGDTIGLYYDPGGGAVLIDEVAYGQEGTAPDPLTDETVARHYDTSTMEYTDEWLRNATTGPTLGTQNNVGNVLVSPPVVINRVLFNPMDPLEGYIELSWKGFPISIANYRIVGDGTTSEAYIVPAGTNLNAANPFYVITESMAPGLFTNMDSTGDNVYLYNSGENLIDEVGWSSSHTQGYFMSRVPDAIGGTTGFNDTSSTANGWFFDQQPTMQLTEISADDANSAEIEVYNPRGGIKVPDPLVWWLDSNLGTMTGTWSPDPIPEGGYSVFTRSGGAQVGLEGDTFTLNFMGPVAVESVGFGTNGTAPDPLVGESAGRYWDTGSNAYTGDWNRNASATGPTWGSQNDVPAVIIGPGVILQEVMYDPALDPDGHFLIVFNVGPFLVDIIDWSIVCDDVFRFSDNYSTAVMNPFSVLILRYSDSIATHMFNSMDAGGDNVYMYDEFGQRIDMVGWDQPHFKGMSVKRVPDGNGTFQGYHDTSSTAAGWVFDSPLTVYLTEVSDDGGSSEIEVYNYWYPPIDFSAPGTGYSFANRTGAVTGTWTTPIADANGHAVFDVDPGFLYNDGDMVTFLQNGILIDEFGYGQYGTVPDPLDGESVQRYYDSAAFGRYQDHWARNTTSGPNFGSVNNVPDENFSSPIVLNEVMFNPIVPGDFFVELFNKGGALINLSGWKIVGDKEFIIPDGTEVDMIERNYYLLRAMDFLFFDPINFDRTGDNIYLYNAEGSLVDMVGWSSAHTMGNTMARVPEGNGTRDGYEDVSSVAAGWRFDQIPTVQLIVVENVDLRGDMTYGHFKSWVTFNLSISNFQSVGDTIDILFSSQEGWIVQILDETGTITITDIFVNADGTVNFTVNVTMPDTIPFAIMDNITITIRSTNSTIIGDTLSLNVRVYPFLNLTKSASPSQIYMNGTGHDEVTTVSINLTGLGAQVAIRRYLDVVFCIDSSGSMDWNDPTDLRITESQNFVASYFDDPDRGAVVDFDDDAVLQPEGNPDGDHLSTNYPQIINNLDLIDSSGATDLSNGLNLSNAEMDQYGDLTTKVPVIICLTDADQLPAGDDVESLAEADYAARMGVIIMTIGLTVPVNGTSELLLKEIANRTGGTYYRADNAGFFTSIYENISSFLTDLAVWDNDTADTIPLVRDVLPPYIRLNGAGNFTGKYLPTLIDQNGPGGTTIIEWNLQWIKLGETITFTFEVVSNVPGFIMTNVFAESRASYTRWDNTTDIVYFPEVWITVLPPSPIPPPLYINMSSIDDVYLWWDQPLIPGTEYYLIYRSPTPTGFDFSSPWRNTNITTDVIFHPTRVSWNDTGAADSSVQWYYCIRSVNALGEMSYSSNTVGKWTRNFAAGTGTFSLPLEPIVPRNTEFYAQDMNAQYIKWMDPGTHFWVQHDQGEGGDNTIMEVGKGFEVNFAGATKYTFVGLPGAMIRYKTDSTVGFDPVTEADSLAASVNPATGDVTLTWSPATGGMGPMGPGDQYYVFSATTRNGFHGTRGSDYQLFQINDYLTLSATDFGAATPGTQLYYMVIPVNFTGTEGASTYSIGVWTSDISGQYDTIGIPLQLTAGDQTADWYCSNILSSVGFNYFMYTDLRWSWHSERMPSGAFDPTLLMTEGYQISTSASTKYTFIGH